MTINVVTVQITIFTLIIMHAVEEHCSLGSRSLLLFYVEVLLFSPLPFFNRFPKMRRLSISGVYLFIY